MNVRDIRREIVFKFGDIRREYCPGGFAWGRFEHLIDYSEALSAFQRIEPGDIGLHRNRGDLSNIPIKGFMKHAWIFRSPNEIVEAVSEGVLRRHSLHPLMSDYALILRPGTEVLQEAKDEACHRAFTLEGVNYDDTFTFDLEIEEKMFADKETAIENMRKYGLGVSCTEAVALCYVGSRRKLALYRTKMGKRQVIMPDSYINTHWNIVWASKHTAPENAAALSLPEEGIEMLKEYWNKEKSNGNT